MPAMTVNVVFVHAVYSNSDSQFVTAARLPDIPTNGMYVYVLQLKKKTLQSYWSVVYSYAGEAENSASVATYGNVEEDTTVIYEQLDAVVMDGQEERIEEEPEYTDMDQIYITVSEWTCAQLLSSVVAVFITYTHSLQEIHAVPHSTLRGLAGLTPRRVRENGRIRTIPPYTPQILSMYTLTVATPSAVE